MPPPARSDKSGSSPKVNLNEKKRVTHARKALLEAEERHKRLKEKVQSRAPEHNGPKGLDPARYGDWEVKGIASDF